jgi:hypothetical protein
MHLQCLPINFFTGVQHIDDLLPNILYYCYLDAYFHCVAYSKHIHVFMLYRIDLPEV